MENNWGDPVISELSSAREAEKTEPEKSRVLEAVTRERLMKTQ
jgi:hypothetical protein